MREFGRNYLQDIDPQGIPNVIYVAGPMAGYEDFNYPLFKRTTQGLRDQGYIVICPTDVGGRLDGGRPGTRTQREYLKACIAALMQCNAIHLLSGWGDSTGARCEAAIAMSLGYTFVSSIGAIVAPPTECVVHFKDRTGDVILGA